MYLCTGNATSYDFRETLPEAYSDSQSKFQFFLKELRGLANIDKAGLGFHGSKHACKNDQPWILIKIDENRAFNNKKSSVVKCQKIRKSQACIHLNEVYFLYIKYEQASDWLMSSEFVFFGWKSSKIIWDMKMHFCRECLQLNEIILKTK